MLTRRSSSLLLALALAMFPLAAHAKKKGSKKGGKARGKAATVSVKVGGMMLDVPTSWEAGRPSSSMRLAQFTLPRAKGDTESAEFVVFYFGPGGGGGVKPNIDRWVGQFDPKEREVKLTEGKSKQGDYVVATISGTFNMPVGPPMGGRSKPVPNAQMLGVIVLNESGPYFLKMWGQKNSVVAAGKDLRKALGAKGKEKPYK